MGFLDRLLGRSTPPPPDLAALFRLPSATVTLEAAAGLRPTGVGSVCVRPAEGAGFARAHEAALGLLGVDGGPPPEETRDAFGYLWTTARTAPDRLADLVTALHGANTAYQDAGFGPALLCTVVGLAAVDPGRVDAPTGPVALVYLYKRGTFYPFAPTGPQRRDAAYELALRAQLDGELPVEPDVARWFPVWDAPGLR